MDLRALRYFCAAHEYGTLTAAARRCHVSQPSISAAIDQLEAQLGVKLFRRHRHGVSATAEGDRLYPLAKQLLDDAGAIGQLFTEHAVQRQVLTVSVLASIDMRRVGTLMRDLLARHPEIELRLVGDDEQSDLRLTSNHYLRKGETFVPLWNDGYVAAVPRRHPLSLERKLELVQLLDYPLIERLNCEFHGQMMALIARHPQAVRIAAKVQSEEWALALVAAGLGVALVPVSSVPDGVDVATCELEDATLSRQVGFAYRGDLARSHRLNEWLSGYRSG